MAASVFHALTENPQMRALGHFLGPQEANTSPHSTMIVFKKHLSFLKHFLVIHFPKSESTILRQQRAFVDSFFSGIGQSTALATS